ncbi:unnamed protein product [Blepharisma stoltei]|uniref:DUF2975 domain-containing protein n=1 Tax=Blepharisma stoltei TaxID=1481888 RepID=A0AAU9JP49_9CILI|nr:unnamed protein product [Blepharisma stoltei]
MSGTENKILIKIGLDLVYIGIVLITFFVNEFSYMESLEIGLIKLSVNYSGDWFSVLKSEPFSYFKGQFCDISDENSQKICDCLSAWEASGILYLIFTSISFVFCAYGLLRLSLKYLGRDFSLYVKHDIEQYIYPALYIIALILYTSISQVFTLDPPKGLSHDYGVKAEPGIILMLVALFIALVGIVYFLSVRKEINEKSDYARPLLSY